MASHTRYLSTTARAVNEFTVRISDLPPISIPRGAVRYSCDIRYSPILPAFLVPAKRPAAAPRTPASVALLFASSPYKVLGKLKNHLPANERAGVFFTQGLASIILLNFTLKRAEEIRRLAGNCPLEFWPLQGGKLDTAAIVVRFPRLDYGSAPKATQLPRTDSPDLAVYVEQISASLGSLWGSYGGYFPQERKTLRQITILAANLIQQHGRLSEGARGGEENLDRQKKRNAIVAALVEISAALSYAVTQGTSGAAPVLTNRSPFPHHSLLGIGGAVRALTKFTRYLESAFMVRSAGRVITEQYARLKQIVPAKIPDYSSGPEYKFPTVHETACELFDSGGELPQEDQVPLIAHFSLRHGFMESKFSVTAASEALTAETLPHWTLMTLSHEIMHSRVRTIFQALFGKTWHSGGNALISKQQFTEFGEWIRRREHPRKLSVVSSLRNVILNFCFAIEKSQHPISEGERHAKSGLSIDELTDLYSRHKCLAAEIIVHFHDYYFVYARQHRMYMRSVWASWIKVAAPYARPLEYLTRSLATVACGTGLKSPAAFDFARDVLLDSLASLEAARLESPLFEELRRLVSPKTESLARAHFDPCYYLIDTVRKYFASRTISSRIDRIESDPFADGSTVPNEYAANIYLFGEAQAVSPVRYLLASLFKTLSGQIPLNDLQWLTAWNYMVISSWEDA